MENLEDKVHDLELFMATHDAQCEERWKTTFNRLEEIDETLERIEGKLMKVASGVIIFLSGLVVTMGMALLDKI
jgi:SMC interacting uncharacterized protein involved in chromosome segregation